MNDGQVMGLFVSVCSRNHGKGMKIEKNKADREEGNFPRMLRDHKNRNFTVSKMIVSTIL